MDIGIVSAQAREYLDLTFLGVFGLPLRLSTKLSIGSDLKWFWLYACSENSGNNFYPTHMSSGWRFYTWKEIVSLLKDMNHIITPRISLSKLKVWQINHKVLFWWLITHQKEKLEKQRQMWPTMCIMSGEKESWLDGLLMFCQAALHIV